mmetsp:Transcript_24529/g.41574  ORF Transcript_24529/g.41574 Transcript_24529/m.41574 type:complete len:85 (+) Transcript_24529:272-526(+)
MFRFWFCGGAEIAVGAGEFVGAAGSTNESPLLGCSDEFVGVVPSFGWSSSRNIGGELSDKTGFDELEEGGFFLRDFGAVETPLV